MIDEPAVQRIDQNDALVLAATAAEQRLFEHFGLEYKAHYVEIEKPRIRVRVLEVGAGSPILIVPGGSGEAFQYVPLMAELKGRRMIVINRPGGGMSDAVDHRQVDLRRLAVDTLTAVLDAFELQRLPVIANSMGGLWAFWLALDKPERVSMMVQAGCPALILDTSAPFAMRLLSSPLFSDLLFPTSQPSNVDQARSGLRFMGSSKETVQALPEPLVEATYRMHNLPTYRPAWLSLMEATLTLGGANERYQLGADQLRLVTQPVLFIWGDHDPFGSVEVAQQAAKSVNNAQLQIIDSGHLPFIDDPKESGRRIGHFLARPPS